MVGGGWFFGVRHNGGPLDSGGLGDKLCMAVGANESVTIGNMRLRNSGSAPITITDVSVIDADGVEDDGAFLVPDDGRPIAGTKSGWEFGNGPVNGENGAPKLAIGADLPKSSTDVFLAVHLRRPDVLGEEHLTGIRVEYRAGTRRYAREIGPQTTLRPGRCF